MGVSAGSRPHCSRILVPRARAPIGGCFALLAPDRGSWAPSCASGVSATSACTATRRRWRCPVMHLLNYGTPEMPSGFLYPRAVAQLYLMAALRARLRAGRVGVPAAVGALRRVAHRAHLGGRPAFSRAALESRADRGRGTVPCLHRGCADGADVRIPGHRCHGIHGAAFRLGAHRAARLSRRCGAGDGGEPAFHTLSIFAAWLCFLPGLLSGGGRTPQINCGCCGRAPSPSWRSQPSSSR